jgi:endogenous inhibitor of DNA gyrase (YacG/DUF329 family)
MTGAVKKGKVEPLRRAVKCPHCGRPGTRADYPFCSPRCASLDLGKWLSGGYSIPGPAAPRDHADDPDRR